MPINSGNSRIFSTHSGHAIMKLPENKEDFKATQLEHWHQQVAALSARKKQAYLLALRITNSPTLAEEAVQDALTKILKRPQPNLDEKSLLYYFLTSVRNAALNIYKGEHHQKRLKRNASNASPAHITSQEEQLIREENTRILRETIRTLPKVIREAINLRYEQGMTQRQASRILKIPRQTMNDRVNRGLHLIRAALLSRGYSALGSSVAIEGTMDLDSQDSSSEVFECIKNTPPPMDVIKPSSTLPSPAPALNNFTNTRWMAKIACMVLVGLLASVLLEKTYGPSTWENQIQPRPIHPTSQEMTSRQSDERMKRGPAIPPQTLTDDNNRYHESTHCTTEQSIETKIPIPESKRFKSVQGAKRGSRMTPRDTRGPTISISTIVLSEVLNKNKGREELRVNGQKIEVNSGSARSFPIALSNPHTLIRLEAGDQRLEIQVEKRPSDEEQWRNDQLGPLHF